MRKQILGLAVAAALAGIGATPVQAADPPPPAAGEKEATAAKDQTDVPVRQVVLFSSGVGYFEHFGSVKGNGSTELRFKTQQINDVLKSLVLQDLDGGKVTTITYASQDPIDKTLRSFQVDITGNPSLADLLNQLRGAKVTATTTQNEKVQGTILGVEKRQEPVGEGKQPREVSVMNLLVGAALRPVRLDEVKAFQLEDPDLRAELEKALAALAQARDQDKKPVQIHFRGDGERRVRVGYVVETPVWKTSYRLILSEGGAGGAAANAPGGAPVSGSASSAAGDKGAEGNGDKAGVADAKKTPLPGKAQLQGWAIVENQTDSDWNNVQLSLVSGRPISFIQNLYSPLYVPRPVVQPELYASLTPQTYSAGMNKGLPQADFAKREMDEARRTERFAESQAESMARLGAPLAAKKPGGGFGGGRGGAEPALPAEMSVDAPMNAAASVSSVASAADVGELFQYTVGSVSLPRQKSAMIPIVADGVEVEKLSIYNRGVLAKYPLVGARVRNTSGKHLLQGPVTVLDAGAYAGDARIDDVPPGQERLLSYGIDQQILVDATSARNEGRVLTGKIVKGVLQVTHKDVFTQEYVAQNKGDKDKTLLIEHPKRGRGWKLVDTQEPVETTETLYRFKGQSPAGKQTKLSVREENVRLQEVAIFPTGFNVLQTYVNTGAIPQAVKDALAKAIAMKTAYAETERQIQQRTARINEITAEQARIRENMKTVQPNTDYYRRLEKKLNDQETEIEKLRGEIEELTKQRDGQRKALEDYVAGLNVG